MSTGVLAFLNARDCGTLSPDFLRVLAQRGKVRCVRVVGFIDADQFRLFRICTGRLRESESQTSQPEQRRERWCSMRRLAALTGMA
jgi:hypothetical protein